MNLDERAAVVEIERERGLVERTDGHAHGDVARLVSGLDADHQLELLGARGAEGAHTNELASALDP